MARPTEEIRKACGIIDGVSNNEFAEVSVNKQTIRDACDRIDASFSDIEDKAINNIENGGVYLDTTTGNLEWYNNGERVKRPAVFAADGEPLEPGETVWGVDSGKKYDVAWLERDVAIVDTYDGLASKVFASKLTHQRPVLDADGVPIREGDTVYSVEDGTEYEVTGVDGAFEIRVKDESMDVGVWTAPCGFTHAKPDLDTWERIEEDATKNPFDYCKDVGHRLDTCESSEAYKARDLVRRAKKLAERGE